MKAAVITDTKKSFPVGKILCLGRNYAGHAKEMKSDVPMEPVVFIKPSSAIIHDGDSICFPAFSQELHHEVEMVVLMGTGGKNIPKTEAINHVAGYGVGLDMTLRDVQSKAKKAGLPWSVAKGFDTSAPVSGFVARERVQNPHNLALRLKVNGELRQSGRTSDMIFPIDFVISYLSTIFTLEPGDLIFTGTPEGVAAVHRGDVLEAALETVSSLTVSVH